MEGTAPLSFADCLKRPFSCPYHYDKSTWERVVTPTAAATVVFLTAVGARVSPLVAFGGLAIGTVVLLSLRKMYHNHGASRLESKQDNQILSNQDVQLRYDYKQKLARTRKKNKVVIPCQTLPLKIRDPAQLKLDDQKLQKVWNAMRECMVNIQTALATNRPLEGIFRKSTLADEIENYMQLFNKTNSGVSKNIKNIILSKLEKGRNTKKKKVSVNKIDRTHFHACLLKRLARDHLLVPAEFYDEFITAGRSHEPQIHLTLFKTIRKLPPDNRLVLGEVMKFAQSVSTYSESTKMTDEKLAMMFGPNILQPIPAEKALFDSDAISRVTQLMMNHSDLLFTS